jgi:hypothetical protein
MYIKEPKPKFTNPEKETKPSDNRLGIVIGFVCLLIFLAINEFEKFTEVDKNGKFQISKKRLEKLHKDTLKLQKSEQYALIALETGYYACLTCKDTTLILLYKNEIWRYGVTMNGKETRYPKSTFKNLVYIIQFSGNLQQCLIEERKKIVMYPLLPENLKRSAEKRLGRPPANPYDH